MIATNIDVNPARLRLTNAGARLLARPWLEQVSTADRRFRWFVDRFQPFCASTATLDELIDRLTISDDVAEALGLPVVEELCGRLLEYGEHLAAMSVDDELFSIVATVAGEADPPSILDALGWSGAAARADAAADADVRRVLAELRNAPFWTPALRRSAARLDALPPAPEALVAELHRAGIVEQPEFDPDGLALAFAIFEVSTPVVLRAARADLDALWSQRRRVARMAAASGNLVARAIARELAPGDAEPAAERRIERVLDELRAKPEPFLALDAPLDARAGAALAEICAWAAADCRAATVGEALDCVRADPSPPISVGRAWNQLRAMDAAEIGTAGRERHDPIAAAARVEAAFRSEDASAADRARLWLVLRRRVLGPGAPATLDEVGRELGVTRERARQLEAKARERLLAEVARRANHPLVRAAARLRQELGTAAPAAAVERQLARSFGGEAPPDLERLAGRLALWLAGPYLEADGWFTLGKADQLADTTNGLLLSATAEGPILEDAAAARLSAELSVKPEHARAWIVALGKYRFQDGWLSRWFGSFADKAEQILLLEGEPLTRDEIFERVGGDYSRGPVGSLTTDPRFVRVSMTEIGLQAWGLDAYSTIEEEIVREIERQGGSASAAHLADTLSSKFGVAEQSVRTYLADGARFSRDESGRFRHAPASAPERTVRPIWLSRACFSDGEQWAYRHEVTDDTLRGSGSGISASFAAYLGATMNEPTEFSTPFGPVRIHRTMTTTSVSTLRAIANAFPALPGDYIFLRRASADSLTVSHLPVNVRRRRIDLHRLASECGLAKPELATFADICRAVGLESDATAAALAERFRRRSESELIAFLPSMPS